jgi:hypothetical protein
MNKEDMINWLESLKSQLGQSQEYRGLWHYEQALVEIISKLKELEDF